MFTACRTALFATSVSSLTTELKSTTVNLNSIMLNKAFETILFNGVTIHGDKPTLHAIMQVVDDYSTLWKDSGSFINLPEEHWMKIPLKADWESKISGRAKVYPLDI